MPKEIRDEVAKEIAKLNARLWGLLASLFVALCAIVVTVLISSNNRSTENMTNYKAIAELSAKLDIQTAKLDIHINGNVKP